VVLHSRRWQHPVESWQHPVERARTRPGPHVVLGGARDDLLDAPSAEQVTGEGEDSCPEVS
jgi:hypothetical protein